VSIILINMAYSLTYLASYVCCCMIVTGMARGLYAMPFKNPPMWIAMAVACCCSSSSTIDIGRDTIERLGLQERLGMKKSG
jgi:hypothetical protein